MEMGRKAGKQKALVTGNVTTAHAFQAGWACTPKRIALGRALGPKTKKVPGFLSWLCRLEQVIQPLSTSFSMTLKWS